MILCKAIPYKVVVKIMVPQVRCSPILGAVLYQGPKKGTIQPPICQEDEKITYNYHIIILVVIEAPGGRLDFESNRPFCHVLSTDPLRL